MDLPAELDAATAQIAEGEFHEAEERLLGFRQPARDVNDLHTLELVLPLLVLLYSSMRPRDLSKAEEFALERERVSDNSNSRLQTALLLYYAADDYPRAIDKLREAIDKTASDGDERTRYASLSLMGQALLDLNRRSEACIVLDEIERMIAARRPIVVGDETGFLEKARDQGLEVNRVRRLASELEPVCRDPEFRKRLQDLQ